MIAAFSVSVRSAIAAATGARSTFVTVHVKLALPLSVPADAVTVTACVPALVYVSVPLITPVVGLIVRLGGSRSR